MATNNESDGPLIQNHDRYEKWGVQYLILCVVLTAVFFILIAVVYFTAPTDAALRGTEMFETATMPLLP